MDYKKSYSVALSGFYLGIIIGFIGALSKAIVMGYIGFIIIAGSLVQTFLFYRCPKCDSSLNIRDRKPKHCPECGCKLE